MAATSTRPNTKDPRTVFVRNLSYGVDEGGLETLFTELGPVRQCFLVRTKGSKQHKGFGFVQFALPEDAGRAVADLNGKEVQGRKLQVESANRRASLTERKRKGLGGPDAAAEAAEPVEDDEAAAEKSGEELAPPSAKPPSKISQPPAAHAAAPPAKRVKLAPAEANPVHKLVRTVALGNLAPEVLQAAIALARQAGPLEEVIESPAPDLISRVKLAADGCKGDVLFLVYTTVKAAMEAVAKLHGQPLQPPAPQTSKPAGKKGKKGKKGKGSSVDAAEPSGAAAAAPVRLWARQVSGEGLHLKKWRVIVRNLAFQVSEAALLKLLQPAGFVWELTLPRTPEGRPKGFAFATFTCRVHAEKAIQLCNGQMVMKRPVACDWALAKAAYEAAKQEPTGNGAPGLEGEGEEGLSDADSEDEGEYDDEEGEEEDEEGSEDEETEGEDEEGDEDDDDDDAAPPAKQKPLRRAQASVTAGAEADPGREHAMQLDVVQRLMRQTGPEQEQEQEQLELQQQKQQKLQQKQQPQQQQKQQPQQQKQQQKQQPAAKPVGPGTPPALQQQQPAKAGDKRPSENPAATAAAASAGEGAPRGAAASAAQRTAAVASTSGKPGTTPESRTVFVRGLALDTTQAELQARLESFGPVKACRLVVNKTTNKFKGTAFVEFRDATTAKKASVACGRARKGEGPEVSFRGRSLDLDLAVTQDEARAISVAAAKQAGHQGSKEKDRRNLYLAKEGAIPEGSQAWLAMSQQDRNKRQRAAQEASTKLQSPNFLVSTTRLSVRNIPPGWDEKRLKEAFVQAIKERATKAAPRVQQVKILRDADRLDEEGKPKSKGLGFIQFEEHEHALVALRQLNNNPAVFSSERRPIVEFALENAKVLKLRDQKLDRLKRQQEPNGRPAKSPRAGPDAAPGDEDGRPAKRARPAGQEEAQENGAKQQQRRQQQQQPAGQGDKAGGDLDSVKGRAAAAAARVGKAPPIQKQQQQQGRLEASKDGGDGSTAGAGGVSKRRQRMKASKLRQEMKQQRQQPQQPAAAAPPPQTPQQQQQAGSGPSPKVAPAARTGATQPRGPTARPAAAAPAPAPALTASSGARQQRRQAHKEAFSAAQAALQQQQQRKRRADDQIDRLASLGGSGSAPEAGGGVRPPRRGAKAARGAAPPAAFTKGADKADRLDQLVAQYKARLVGGDDGAASGSGTARATAGAGAGPGAGMKRWFE